MGSKWFTGGVVAAANGRIQFDFMFEGVRYRPSIRRPPSEANLRRARERLDEIKRQIDTGTFSCAEEFPDYRLLRRLNGTVRVRSCNDVFDEFLAHCEARLARQDLAAVTLSSYRRVLNGVWRPELGKSLFHQVRYSRLVAIADRKPWSAYFTPCRSTISRDAGPTFHDHAGPEFHGMSVQDFTPRRSRLR
jgi:integrase